MKMLKVGFITLSITLIAISCASSGNETTHKGQSPTSASPAANATPDMLATARINYEKNCKTCHGDTGEGGLVTIDDKKFKVPSLTQGHALNHTDIQLAKQISNGAEEMPAFKDKLTPAEINGLVNYIRKQFQGK
jgi:mono/diheme cytochrome c family protein